MPNFPLCRGRHRLRRACLLLAALPAAAAYAEPEASGEIEFQAGFMFQHPDQPANSAQLALSQLASTVDLVPGTYRVELSVNFEYVGQREIAFELDSNGKQLQPCLSPTLLGELGLRLDGLPDPALLEQPCLDLPAVVPGARVDFDGSRLRLAVSIPQIALRRDIRGQVDPALWDSGITAAFVNYQASTLQGQNRGQGRFDSHDLYLNSGVNLADWRLRSSQTWRQDSQGHREWTRAYTYAQTDLPGTWGNLTIGETFTDSDVFRGIPVTGVRLASDFDMLPDTHRSYAPTIRGVAQTRAKLEIWQNGYPLYSTYVSPGPYAIDDLAVGGTGELEVVLTEADGQVRRFIQPYANIGNLLRPGVARYSTTAGRYNPTGDLQTPQLWQGTLALGTAWNTTLYGGLMASQGYRAEALGIARDLGSLGAVSFDVTHSNSAFASPQARDLDGMSYSFKYSKTFGIGTNLRFAGYRYSTEGYRDFEQWVRQRSHDQQFRGGQRRRLEASLYQTFGERSSVSLNLTQQDYWQRQDVERQFQVNLSTSHRGVSYHLYASQSLQDNGYGKDRQVGLSLSFPLAFGRSSNMSMNTQHTRNGSRQQASLTGSYNEQLSYNLSASRNERQQHDFTVGTGYQAAHATLGAGLSKGEGYHSLSLHANGALLVHADGIEAGPYLGETMALVEVPGIADVGLQNTTAVRTNAKGYALLPYLRPYKSNSLVLNTDRLGPDVEIDNGTAQVVPRRGAVVKATFQARRVNRLVLTTLLPNGQPLPFGAQLADASGEVLGMVGQAGQVILTTSLEAQQLTAHWGDDAAAQCSVHLAPSAMPEAQGYRLQTLTCL